MATVTGGAGADGLTGTAEADLLLGLAGDDTLRGGTGADTLDAGAGASDSLDGGSGEDRAVLDRSAATDALTLHLLDPGFVSALGATRLTGVEALWLRSGTGGDRLLGGDGADQFEAGGGDDALQGGAGGDTLSGEAGEDTLGGGAGADRLQGGAAADLFVLHLAGEAIGSTLAAIDRITDFNAAEGDRLMLRGQPVGAAILALPGGEGRFAFGGGAPLPVGFAGALAPAAAPLAGLALPDTTGGEAFRVFWLPEAGGGGGWVLLDADRDGRLGGADLVLRLDGVASLGAADFVAGSFARLGTAAADSIAGGAAAETIHGFAGADRLAGGDGSDALLGGAEADTLAGEAGFDTLRGEAGADSLAGGAGPDVLDGGAGGDWLDGGDASDLLLGRAGADLLVGGEGADTLEGQGGDPDPGGAIPGAGADTLLGGAGADLFQLHRGLGEAAWSGLSAMAHLVDFDAAGGDRLRISEGWAGASGGAGASTGLIRTPDGVDRPLLFAGALAEARTSLAEGLRLPAQGGFAAASGAVQVFWVPAVVAPGGAAAGGWLVADLDRDGRLGAADLVVRIGSVDAPAVIGAADFVEGSFFRLGGAAAPAPSGTAGDDRLAGGSLSESFLGSPGSDSLAGGAGAANAVSYAGLSVAIHYRADPAAPGAGTVGKGTATDRLSAIHAIAGTAGNDTLDGSAALAGAYALSLEGRGGDDRLVGDGTAGVQASFASSPGAILVDLGAGVAADGWGGTDALVAIRRVAATSAYDDTVIGSAGDDVFLSGMAGSKRFDGGAGGFDEYRYAGAGSVRIALLGEIDGVFRLDPRAVKPGGIDRLIGIEAAIGGAGDDTLLGAEADERFAGGAGTDSLDGGAGLDLVVFDLASGTAGLPSRGVVVDLDAGTGTDPWSGATEALRNIESAWGTQWADDLTGRTLPGVATWLRGLGGDDTLRAAADGSRVTVDYGADPSGVRVELGLGWAWDGFGGTDRLVRIGHATGSAFDDSLAGSALANRLEGGAGADTLDGGAGVDTLAGGPGNDLIVIDDPRDQVVEAEGEGEDTVLAGVSHTLSVTVEHLILLAGRGDLFAFGTAAANRMLGNEGRNVLDAGDGADTVEGGAGDDRLYGQAGDDSLVGGVGADWLLGGGGADTLEGGDGGDVLDGEAGAALIRGGAGNDLINGGEGADTLEGGTEDDRIWGATGADTIAGGTGADWIWGGDGWDTVEGGDGNDVLYGERGFDVLIGGAGPDVLFGSDGNDTLVGNADVDRMYGQLGNDSLSGGDATDFLLGRDGDDTLDGGQGLDGIYGEAGADLIYGGNGLITDNLFGGLGNDTLDGSGPPGSGDRDLGEGDRMGGGPGNDVYFVDTRGDLVFEADGAGYDVVYANVPSGGGYELFPAVEALVMLGSTRWGYGNRWNNPITGNASANLLDGSGGSDTLTGNTGDDTLKGGSSADHFVFHVGDGADQISDFQPGADKINLVGFGDMDVAGLISSSLQVGVRLILDLGSGQEITLTHVNRSSIGFVDFILS